jgi:hypothetical protein
MAYPLLDTYGVSSHYGPRANLFGDFHHGVDIPTPVGVAVPCIASGVVRLAGPITFNYAGKFYVERVVCVNRDDGKANLYDHLSRVDVRVGQRVEKGQPLGLTGQSGYVTGPHLHIQQMMRHYQGGKFADYPTEDPEPELRAWRMAQGAPDDMTHEHYVRTAYAAFQPDAKPSDDVVRAHAAHLATLDAAGVADWTRRFALDGRWVDWPEHNALALTSYADATGRGDGNPRQWAVDRVQGGDTFDAIIHRDSAASAQHERELTERLAAQEGEIQRLHIALEKTERPVAMPQPDEPKVAPQETPKDAGNEEPTPPTTPAEGASGDLSPDEVSFIKRLYLVFANALLGR